MSHPQPASRRRRSATTALLVALAACGGGADAAGTARVAGVTTPPDVPRQVAALAAPGLPYRELAVAGGGAVRGAVLLSGPAPRDTVVRPAVDVAACGTQFTDETVSARAGRLAGVAVWLVGLRAGKPLPLERRYELANERCQLVPRLQAAVVGGTLNVRSADRHVHHRERFVRQTNGSPVVAQIETNDDGQVVPVEQVLRAPGAVRVRCDVHPWTDGWVVAFDHPYFAVTGGDGSFTIDDVPPGRYTLVAWHPRLGVVEQAVTVAAGGSEAVELKLGEGVE